MLDEEVPRPALGEADERRGAAGARTDPGRPTPWRKNPNVTFAIPARPLCIALAALAVLTACGSLSQVTGEESVDYRTQGNKTAPLDIPPDLTQLARDPRYAPQGASVSASSFQALAAPQAATAPGASRAALRGVRARPGHTTGRDGREALSLLPFRDPERQRLLPEVRDRDRCRDGDGPRARGDPADRRRGVDPALAGERGAHARGPARPPPTRRGDGRGARWAAPARPGRRVARRGARALALVRRSPPGREEPPPGRAAARLARRGRGGGAQGALQAGREGAVRGLPEVRAGPLGAVREGHLCAGGVGDRWLAAASCGAEPVPVEGSPCVRYGACGARGAVEFCTHEGNHGVPAPMAHEVWRFFAGYARR